MEDIDLNVHILWYLEMDFYYNKGNGRNILHDSQAAIDYCNTYFEQWLSNVITNRLPIFPRVFIDKSYCHLDHHIQEMWVSTKGIINEQGRKPMPMIFRAFVVYTPNNKHEACANVLIQDNKLI